MANIKNNVDKVNKVNNVDKVKKKNIETINYNNSRGVDIREGFDGIRKSNSRIIFAILLFIIILDFFYECIL
jgi:hypothetical protein